ncbi:unnamed protein product [Spirodela intermedia]|uniref:Uncharacterized protein n=1 Tax=Spirodela intermedia TaxID=51605 RepID=A0A7I8JDP9_SPIIN|nr:unnamed protein product [Spirodela intermedia]CAA6668247.1 unnamed protein product [Spirodela intermedia]
MEFPLLETLKSQPVWVLPLLSVGFFNLLRASLYFLWWIYVFFLRPSKNLLGYGRWAIVTGPTDGIGKSMAFEMARKGVNLVLVGRRPDMLKQVTGAIKAEVPTIEVVTVVFDLNEDIADGVKRLGDAIRGLDCLHEVDEEMFSELVNVNMEALTDITRAIVNLGSASTVVTPSYPMLAVYAGTKAYVDSLSRSLHQEYKNNGIDIQCQVPLFVVTKMVPDKKLYFFNPSPDGYAPSAVRAIGYGATVIPYWRQSLQAYLATYVPVGIFNEQLLRFCPSKKSVVPYG